MRYVTLNREVSIVAVVIVVGLINSSSGAVLAIRPGRPWPTQILAWPTQIYFWPTLAAGLPKVIVHII